VILHVVETHQTLDARVLRARKSWESIYGATIQPVHVNRWERSARQIGDPRDLPMLRDVLEQGLKQAQESDVIMLTNTDITLATGVDMAVKQAVQAQGAVCSFRLNTDRPMGRFESPRKLSRDFQPDYGRDLFAFSKEWLEAHWKLVPDCFLGEVEWDLILTILIRRSIGIEVRTTAEFHQHTDAELPLGFVMHEKHVPVWKTLAGLCSPSKTWNWSVAKAWYRENRAEHLNTLG